MRGFIKTRFLTAAAAAATMAAATGCPYGGPDCVDFLPVSDEAKANLNGDITRWSPETLDSYSGHEEEYGPLPESDNPGSDFLRSSMWNRYDIPVCWEDYAAGDAANRAIVKQAVEDTWEAAFIVPEIPSNKRIHFTGWGRCTGLNGGIRIQVSDEGPHVKLLGRYLANFTHGMVLNFTFNNWSTYCSTSESIRQNCVYAIAAHEFGHALGFAHEQNRSDRPSSCTDAPQGTDGDLYIGEWDLDSIMNYCNPIWNNGGVLSDGDLFAVRAVYADEILDKSCDELLTGHTYRYDGSGGN